MAASSGLNHVATKKGIKIYAAYIDSLAHPLIVYKSAFSSEAEARALMEKNGWLDHNWKGGGGIPIVFSP